MLTGVLKISKKALKRLTFFLFFAATQSHVPRAPIALGAATT
jgi:hypothetical protein